MKRFLAALLAGLFFWSSALAAVTTTGAGKVPSVASSGTWNPSDKAASLTLSNGNLTVQNTVVSNVSVRSVTSHSTGKFCFGLKLSGSSSGGNTSFVGVGDATASLSNLVGSDTHGWGAFNQDGIFRTNGGNVSPSTGVGGFPSAANQWQIFCADLDNHLGWFFSAASGQWNAGAGTPAAGTGGFTIGTGAIYAMVTVSESVAGSQVTGDFSASNFALPSGFSAWN